MLLDKDHRLLKISDLGIAKLATIVSEVLQGDYTYDNGTPGYRPSEMIKGDIDSCTSTCTSKVDVFSLGRTIWSMIIVRCCVTPNSAFGVNAPKICGP